MALTIEIEGLGVIANADAVTNDTGGDGTGDWGFTGSGGVSNGLTTDTFYYGTSSIAMALSGAGKNGWLWFNVGRALDFTTTLSGQHIYIWVHCPTLGLSETLANVGLGIRIGTNTSNHRTYTVGGNDDSNGWDGAWRCFVIDPTKTGSITDTGTYSAATVQYIGIKGQTTATAKGDNFFVSQIAVGSGLTVTGTSTTGWSDAVTYCTDLPNRAWGMLQEREGIYYQYGDINIGETGVTGTHTGGTSTTVMTDSAADFAIGGLVGKTIYNTTDVSSGVITANTNTSATVASLTGGTFNDFRVNDAYTITAQIANVSFADDSKVIQAGISEYWISSAWSTSADIDYMGLTVQDRTTFTTTFSDGVIVGSDKGRSGSTIIGNANHDYAVILDGTNNAASVTTLYGTTLRDLTGGITLGDDTDHKYYSTSFIGCTQVNPVGAPVIRNCTFAETADLNGSLLWNANIDIQNSAFIANTTGEAIEHDTWNGVESGTATTTDGTGVTLTDTAATFTGGNVSINDIVYNETTGGFGTVTAITDATHLDCSAGLSTGGWTSTDVYSCATPISYINLTFSGNTVDVNNTTSPANLVAISKAGTSDPVTELGFTVIQGSVTVKVTVKDALGTVISGVRTGVYLTSDRTEILNADTDGSGISTTTYAGSTPVEVEVRCRKASSADNPKYKAFSSIQTIQSGTGLDFAVTLTEDTINNATT